MPYNFTAIEKKWQQYWLENKTFRAIDPADAGSIPKAYVLDMFPYPSGAGLHVGHPVGYIATDIVVAIPADAGLQRAASDGVGRVRPSGRAVRRSKTTSTRATPPKRTSTTSAGKFGCSA